MHGFQSFELRIIVDSLVMRATKSTCGVKARNVCRCRQRRGEDVLGNIPGFFAAAARRCRGDLGQRRRRTVASDVDVERAMR